MPYSWRYQCSRLRWVLPILCLLNFAACHKPLEPIDGSVSVQCDPAKQKCISVTQGFLLEHGQLFDELITCKAKLAAKP